MPWPGRPRGAAATTLETDPAVGHAGPMLDRLIDRLPALLLLAIVALAAHVAVMEAGELRLLIASVPAFVLLVVYLRSGPGEGGAGGRGGGRAARSEARAGGRAR